MVHKCIFPNIFITTRSQLVKNSGFNPPPVNCWSWPALHQSDRSPPGSTNRKRGGRRPGFYRRIYTTGDVGLYGTALTLIAGRGRGNCSPRQFYILLCQHYPQLYAGQCFLLYFSRYQHFKQLNILMCQPLYYASFHDTIWYVVNICSQCFAPRGCKSGQKTKLCLSK